MGDNSNEVAFLSFAIKTYYSIGKKPMLFDLKKIKTCWIL